MGSAVPHTVRDMVLRRARERNIPIEFAIDDKASVSLKSRFLSADDVDTGDTILVAAPNARYLPAPIKPGVRVQVTLVMEGLRYTFTSVVLGRSRVSLASGSTTGAVALRYPQTLMCLQRRRYYRAKIPAGTKLAVECTAKSGNGKDAPFVRFPAQATDISVGGMGLAVPRAGRPLARVESRWVVAFDLPDVPERLNFVGEIRHLRRDTRLGLIAGVQFLVQEDDLGARKGLIAIAHYVAGLERVELKKVSEEK